MRKQEIDNYVHEQLKKIAKKNEFDEVEEYREFIAKKPSRWMTVYDAEQFASQMAINIADQNDLPHNFYGDCYSDEIKHAISRLTEDLTENEYDSAIDELESVFYSYVLGYLQEQEQNKDDYQL